MIVSECVDCGEFRFLPLNRTCRDCYVEETVFDVCYKASVQLEGDYAERIKRTVESVGDWEVDIVETDICFNDANGRLFGHIQRETRTITVEGNGIENSKKLCKRMKDVLERANIGIFEGFDINYIRGDIGAGITHYDIEEKNEFTYSDEDGFEYEWGSFRMSCGTDFDDNSYVTFTSPNKDEYAEGVRKLLSIV